MKKINVLSVSLKTSFILGLFLFLQSCSVDDITSKEANYQANLLEQAKKFVPEKMNQNPNNIFLKRFPLTFDWGKYTTDSTGVMHIPAIPLPEATDKFELIISNKEGQLSGNILQSRRKIRNEKSFNPAVSFGLNGKIENKQVASSPKNSTARYSDSDYTPINGFQTLDEYLGYIYGKQVIFKASMECPVGTTFDSNAGVCNWPFYSSIGATGDFLYLEFDGLNTESIYHSILDYGNGRFPSSEIYDPYGYFSNANGTNTYETQMLINAFDNSFSEPDNSYITETSEYTSLSNYTTYKTKNFYQPILQTEDRLGKWITFFQIKFHRQYGSVTNGYTIDSLTKESNSFQGTYSYNQIVPLLEDLTTPIIDISSSGESAHVTRVIMLNIGAGTQLTVSAGMVSKTFDHGSAKVGNWNSNVTYGIDDNQRIIYWNKTLSKI